MTTDRCSCGNPAPYHITHNGRVIHVCGACHKRLTKPVGMGVK